METTDSASTSSTDLIRQQQQQQQQGSCMSLREPSRKRLRRSAAMDISNSSCHVADDGSYSRTDEDASDVDGRSFTAGHHEDDAAGTSLATIGNKDDSHDTLGSLLSPAEALSRKRRTPGCDDICMSAGDGGKATSTTGAAAAATAAKRRQSRTPEGAKESRAERRFVKAQELAATEANYVRILHVIVRVVREEVAQFLPQKSVELIFNGLEPIYELHAGIEADLRAAIGAWDGASTTVGSAFASRAERLSQLYPPFVNFFDQAKEEISMWERRCPRFRAYLRQCRARPECLRQSLADLMIRPVQRLPSVTLILVDLLKYTGEDSPDYACLQRALSTVRRALEHINEEKRTTDLRVALFDVMNEVENFPPALLSSHRSIVDRFDVVEVGAAGSGICRPGANLTIFLLTDYLLVAKRRPSVPPSSAVGGGHSHHHRLHHRSPRQLPASIRSPSTAKPLRHLELLPLNSVRAVHDIRSAADDFEDKRRLFAIECHAGETGDDPYAFCFALADFPGDDASMPAPEGNNAAAAAASASTASAPQSAATSSAPTAGRDKASVLRSVCEQIGRVTCCANPLDLLVSPADPANFPLDLAGIFDKQNVLSAKARRFGRRVVTRVLSNRTPRRTLSRALLLSSAAAAAAAAAAGTGSAASSVPVVAAAVVGSPACYSGSGGESEGGGAFTSTAAGLFNAPVTTSSAADAPDTAGSPSSSSAAANPAAAAAADTDGSPAPLVFKKPDAKQQRPKSRQSSSSSSGSSAMFSSVRRGLVSLRHSVAAAAAGGKRSSRDSVGGKAVAAAAAAAAAAVHAHQHRQLLKHQLPSTSSLSLMRRGSELDRSSTSLASLASVDVMAGEDGANEDAAGREAGGSQDAHHRLFHHRLYEMSAARASSATLGAIDMLPSCTATAPTSPEEGVGGRYDDMAASRSQLPSVASAASSGGFPPTASGSGSGNSSRFSIGGGASAKRFRKHLSSWSLFKGK